MQPPELRHVRPEDDPQLAALIRAVMTEFGASGPGFSIHDAEVDSMSQAYSAPRSRYFVIAQGDRVLGGGGLAPLAGADESVG
ncbi:MAG: GNAT family N-acetyltransferase, partial [Polyangiaceae bacterium]|nr:GNAT family N-acetyltransferase [Polyangiaceae bacterium]